MFSDRLTPEQLASIKAKNLRLNEYHDRHFPISINGLNVVVGHPLSEGNELVAWACAICGEVHAHNTNGASRDVAHRSCDEQDVVVIVDDQVVSLLDLQIAARRLDNERAQVMTSGS